MVAISFSVFKDKLLDGTKTQTMRELNIPRLEQMRDLGIQIYWKQRTKESEKLFDAIFKSVKFLAFDSDGLRWEVLASTWETDRNLFIDPDIRELSHEEKNTIARKDGFESIEEMNGWFLKTYGSSLYESDPLGLTPVFMAIEWEPTTN